MIIFSFYATGYTQKKAIKQKILKIISGVDALKKEKDKLYFQIVNMRKDVAQAETIRIFI